MPSRQSDLSIPLPTRGSGYPSMGNMYSYLPPVSFHIAPVYPMLPTRGLVYSFMGYLYAHFHFATDNRLPASRPALGAVLFMECRDLLLRRIEMYHRSSPRVGSPT